MQKANKTEGEKTEFNSTLGCKGHVKSFVENKFWEGKSKRESSEYQIFGKDRRAGKKIWKKGQGTVGSEEGQEVWKVKFFDFMVCLGLSPGTTVQL